MSDFLSTVGCHHSYNYQAVDRLSSAGNQNIELVGRRVGLDFATLAIYLFLDAEFQPYKNMTFFRHNHSNSDSKNMTNDALSCHSLKVFLLRVISIIGLMTR